MSAQVQSGREDGSKEEKIHITYRDVVSHV